MAQQRWKTGVQRDDFFVSPDLIFQKIDDARGNGICAGPKGIKRKQDLIIEGALISSVLNKVRFPNLNHENSNNNDDNEDNDKNNLLLSPPRYCSICCCFLGTPREEFERLHHFFEINSKVKTNQNSTEKLLSSLDFDAFEAVASSAGFSSKTHPRWFAESCSTNNNNNNIYSFQRCDLCHKTRCLVPELPQTLEEVGLFIQNTENSFSHYSLVWKSFSKLISLAKYFDEGLFGICRAILMLVDEVVGGCEMVTKEQHKMKSGNWIVVQNNKNKKSGRKSPSSARKIFKPLQSYSFPKNHKSKNWRVNRLLSIVTRKIAKLTKLNDREKYYSRLDVAIVVDNEEKEETTNQNDVAIQTIFQYSREIHHRINFFCSCFDPGLKLTHSEDDLFHYGKAVDLINEVISGVAKYFFDFSEIVKSNKEKIFRFITLPQILTLRCCLQNNQHRSLIPNPFNVFVENFDDHHHHSANNKTNNNRNTSNKSDKTTTKASVVKSKSEKQLEENAKSCIREIKKLMCHPLMMSEEEEELIREDSDDDDDDDSDDDESSDDNDDDETSFSKIRPVVTIGAQALFVNTSRLNHCCHPNACVQPASTVRGAALRVSTLSSVKPGQEIRISYVELEDVEKDKKKVHRYLKKQYGFDCED